MRGYIQQTMNAVRITTTTPIRAVFRLNITRAQILILSEVNVIERMCVYNQVIGHIVICHAIIINLRPHRMRGTPRQLEMKAV